MSQCRAGDIQIGKDSESGSLCIAGEKRSLLDLNSSVSEILRAFRAKTTDG